MTQIKPIMAALLCFSLLSLGNVATAQPEDSEPLRIATKLFPPFVMTQDDSFTGFSIQLWEAIALEAGLAYELYEVETVADQLNAVQSGEADAAVAGISITSQRETQIDFSFPFFDSGLQIMARADGESSILTVMSAVFSPQFIQFLLVVVAFIVIAAHLLWWFERRSHPEEMQTYRAGIGHALWWAAVTVIGFDEKPPATLAGRLMALIWMFAGIFIIANLTATLTAGATLRGLRGEINDVSDLRTHQVAAITATTSAEYLANNGIAYTPVERVEDAYELLRAGDVDAVVYDAPVLRYYVKTEGRGEIQVVGQIFEPEKYGIALPSDSPHRESINQAILRVQESGAYQDIYNRWFGAN